MNDTVEITIFTSRSGPLTKRISLDSGEIASEGLGYLARGTARRLPLRSAQDLADCLTVLSVEQALGLGRLAQGLGEEVPIHCSRDGLGENSLQEGIRRVRKHIVRRQII